MGTYDVTAGYNALLIIASQCIICGIVDFTKCKGNT